MFGGPPSSRQPRCGPHQVGPHDSRHLPPDHEGINGRRCQDSPAPSSPIKPGRSRTTSSPWRLARLESGVEGARCWVATCGIRTSCISDRRHNEVVGGGPRRDVSDDRGQDAGRRERLTASSRPQSGGRRRHRAIVNVSGGPHT